MMRSLRRLWRILTATRVTPLFRWYDLWVGAYVDAEKRRVYVLPLPMVGLVIQLPPAMIRRGDFERFVAALDGRSGPLYVECSCIEGGPVSYCIDTSPFGARFSRPWCPLHNHVPETIHPPGDGDGGFFVPDVVADGVARAMEAARGFAPTIADVARALTVPKKMLDDMPPAMSTAEAFRMQYGPGKADATCMTDDDERFVDSVVMLPCASCGHRVALEEVTRLCVTCWTEKHEAQADVAHDVGHGEPLPDVGARPPVPDRSLGSVTLHKLDVEYVGIDMASKPDRSVVACLKHVRRLDEDGCCGDCDAGKPPVFRTCPDCGAPGMTSYLRDCIHCGSAKSGGGGMVSTDDDGKGEE